MAAVSSRIFQNGNSQAVRIPQELRLDARLVEISRLDNGDLLVHPVREGRGQRLLDAFADWDDAGFYAALDDLRPEAPTQKEREAL